MNRSFSTRQGIYRTSLHQVVAIGAILFGVQGAAIAESSRPRDLGAPPVREAGALDYSGWIQLDAPGVAKEASTIKDSAPSTMDSGPAPKEAAEEGSGCHISGASAGPRAALLVSWLLIAVLMRCGRRRWW